MSFRQTCRLRNVNTFSLLTQSMHRHVHEQEPDYSWLVACPVNNYALRTHTFILGDTAFFLQVSLAIGGKSLRNYEEIYGQAKPIEFVYDLLQKKEILNNEQHFTLYNLVQTQTVTDFHPDGQKERRESVFADRKSVG